MPDSGPTARDRGYSSPFGKPVVAPRPASAVTGSASESVATVSRSCFAACAESTCQSLPAPKASGIAQSNLASPEGIDSVPWSRASNDPSCPARQLPDSLLKPHSDLPGNAPFRLRSRLKLKPRNFRSQGLATALFSLLTFSLSFTTINWLTLAITRSPRVVKKPKRTESPSFITSSFPPNYLFHLV